MPNVFLAYARADAAFASRLSDALRQLGVRTLDPSTDPRFDEDWDDLLRTSLANADGMVLVATDSALDSAWPMMQFGAAMSKGMRIIPVLPPGEVLHGDFSMMSRRQILNAEGLSESEIAECVIRQPAA